LRINERGQKMTTAIKCAYSVTGSGPPLFLIHGIGAQQDAWRFLLPKLSKNFTVVTYDLRGHGASPMSAGGFGLDDLVADLELVRKETGIKAAHFAGHSLGGMIGPAYARRFPKRVLSLGLLSTAAFRTAEDRAKVSDVVSAMRRNGIPDVLATLTNRWFTNEFILANPDVVEARLKQVIETDPEIFLQVFEIYADTEMGPWLREIQTPALVLTGENDGGCNPRLNRQIAAALQNAELVILPEYKHSLLLEAGTEVADNLMDFINRCL